MNKFIKYLLVVSLFSLMWSGQASAANYGEYLKFVFSEKKSTGGQVLLQLKSYSMVYGDYSGSYKRYDAANPLNEAYEYHLDIYNSKQQNVGMFVVPSSRFSLTDGIDINGKPTGGIKEVDEGEILAFVPYESWNLPAYVKIYANNLKKSGLIELNSAQILKENSNLVRCKNENQGLVPANYVFDIDGDGQISPKFDGDLLNAYMLDFDLRNIQIDTGSEAKRDGDAMMVYLDCLKNNKFLDVDGNTKSDAYTDGVIIKNYISGFYGTALLAKKAGVGAIRKTAEEIFLFLNNIPGICGIISNVKQDVCCGNLIPARQPSGAVVCVQCGNQICSRNENYMNCPEDCMVGNVGLAKNDILKRVGPAALIGEVIVSNWRVFGSLLFALCLLGVSWFIVKKNVRENKDKND